MVLIAKTNELSLMTLPYERLLKSLKHFHLSFHVKSHLYIPIVSYIEMYRFI